MPRQKNDLITLARAAKEHLNRAIRLGDSLDERQQAGMKEAKARGEAWQPDDMWRNDFEKVSNTIARIERVISGAQEANKKQLGGMTVEQLEAQFKSEMLRAAVTFTREDWAALDRIRMKQALK